MYYDVIIVGGGTAGSILAARLTEDSSRSVCVVEAGHDYRTVADLPSSVRTHRFFQDVEIPAESNTNDPSLVGTPDWGYTARATSLQPRALLPRGKVIGGSSSINGAVWFHPLRQDLDEWAAAGNPTWAYDVCHSLMTRIERDLDYPNAPYHGSAGPIPVGRAQPADWAPINAAFHEACLGLGFPDCPDFNAPGATGAGPIPVNMHQRTRYSSAVGYLIPARERLNLEVLGDTYVTRLVIRAGSVRGIEVRTTRGIELIDGREVILAAGAIGTPHLLLRSGIGPAAQLGAVGVEPIVDLDGVGRNLRDHPVLCVSWETTKPVVRPTAGPATTGQVGMRATTPGSDDVEDMRVMCYRSEGQNRFGIPFSLMRAASAGSVTLASPDPESAPLVDVAHLDDRIDRERMVAILDVVTEIGEHAAFDGLRGRLLSPVPTRSPAALREWMLRTVTTGHHASGTCKMGPATDPTTVVDEFGRVHGIDGLRVVDASVMIDCPRVNINATTMLVAEKFAAAYASQDGGGR